MTSLATLKHDLLADSAVRAEYDRLGAAYALVRESIEADRAPPGQKRKPSSEI